MAGKPRRKMSRRELLKGVALGGAALAGAGALASCSPAAECPAPGVPEKWDEADDVVIVGGGGTGIVAAIAALEAGASVTVLEKATVVGGTTAVSGGLIQASATEFQRAAGIEDDTPEAHLQYWMTAAEGLVDPDLVRVMAEKAPDNVQWLVDHGMEYVSVHGVPPIPYVNPSVMVPRIHVPAAKGEAAQVGTGAVQIEVLNQVAQDMGARFMLETTATSLVHDPERGVLCVGAKSGGNEIYVQARRAVILATGGFDHNEEMARAFSPQQLWALESGRCLCAPTDTGDGIRMAMELGADLAGLGGTIGVASTMIGVAPSSVGQPEVPGIWVNKYGQRFVNEGAQYAYAMRAVFDQEQHVAWAIFDEGVREMGGAAIGGLWGVWSDDLSEELASGQVKTADSPGALAGVIRVNGEQLEAAVSRWNEDMAKGQDTVFRRECALVALDRPPYYATQITEVNLGSCGGLKIDTAARVVDVSGEIIPRLYAGGMVAGGFIGPYYPGSGTALSATVCFGRIAGVNAAKEEAWS
jgi:urocanate reductase